MSIDFDWLEFLLKNREYETRPAGTNRRGLIREQILLSWLEKNKKVLDIGCKEGIIGSQAKKKGCQVIGVEIDREKALKARRHYHQVMIGDIEREETFVSLERDFEVILCADVLEHLIHPKETLLNLKRHVVTGGRFLISIPNIAHWSIRSQLLFGHFEYKEKGILDKTHLRFFTLQSFTHLLQEVHVKILATDFIYSPSPLDQINNQREKWEIIDHYQEFFALQFLFNVEVFFK